MSADAVAPVSADGAAEAIRTAQAAIDPVFLNTPLMERTGLDAALGAEIALKVECLNPIRSFKGRGTEAFAAALPAASHLVCASAGNFGQGLARAGVRRGHTVTVFAAEGANPMKVAAMRRLGAEVVISGTDFDEAKATAREAAAGGARFVEDGVEPAITFGAGTVGPELTGAKAADVVLIPLGNGALANGIAAWYRAMQPGARVVGVVATGAPAMKLSFEARRPVATDRVDTIADGIAVRVPVAAAVADMVRWVDDVVAVEDSAILEAIRLLDREIGLLVEPAGAAGLAALLTGDTFSGARVVTILCGSNVTAEQVAQWLG